MAAAKKRPKRGPPKRTSRGRTVSPPKGTGGGGFGFEDQVVAWLLAHMLSNDAPFGVDAGTLERLDFQTSPEGWELDDVLATTKAAGGALHRTAISIKSNLQFVGSSPPPGFVAAAWSQFLRITSAVVRGSAGSPRARTAGADGRARMTRDFDRCPGETAASARQERRRAHRLPLYNAASPLHFGLLTPSSLISMVHVPMNPKAGRRAFGSNHAMQVVPYESGARGVRWSLRGQG